MFETGDIVEILAPSAGKRKYHLCVCAIDEMSVAHFLFINSKQGFEADFVLEDGTIACLPKSPTGKSVISCNMLVRYRYDQLQLFRARKMGVFEKALAEALAAFVAQSPALNKTDRQRAAQALLKFAQS